MGYYINENSKGEPAPSKGKVQFLINDVATVTDATFQDNLICVCENGMFDAAGYCYSEDEFKAFTHPDGRRKTFLVYPHAKKVSGYE